MGAILMKFCPLKAQKYAEVISMMKGAPQKALKDAEGRSIVMKCCPLKAQKGAEVILMLIKGFAQKDAEVIFKIICVSS